MLVKWGPNFQMGALDYIGHRLYLPSCAIQKGRTVKFKSVFTTDQRSTFLQALVGVSLSHVLKLQLNAIGYRVEKQGKSLFFSSLVVVIL